MPFQKISALFASFAHAYPTAFDWQGKPIQSALALEASQPYEPMRLGELVYVAKTVNPNILVFISLGWGHYDWSFISADYNAARADPRMKFNFPQSVVELIRAYKLDGFDIDDESIGGSSGSISQPDFDAVLRAIRIALDEAGQTDKKRYYFSITPAGGAAMITNDNIGYFDLVNTQNYGDSSYKNFEKFPNAHKAVFAYGIDSEGGSPVLPTKADIAGMAGAFNWSLSADSNYGYRFTDALAKLVGYPKK